MQVKDVMTEDPVVITADATLIEAAKKMHDMDCGTLPVKNGSNLVGIITDRDITIWGIALGKDPYETSVSDIMSTDIISCSEDETLERAADMMSINGVRRLVVTNQDNTIVGILSIIDLMKNIGDENITDDIMHHVLKYA